MRSLIVMLLAVLVPSLALAQAAPTPADPAARVAQLEKQLAACQEQLGRLQAQNRSALDFRAMLAMPYGGGRWAPPLSDRAGLQERVELWSQEGFNNVVWWINCELFGGSQCLLQLQDYPEARELDEKQVEKNAADFTAALSAARQHQMDNYLYTTAIHWTKAFGKAHNLDKPVRTDLTRAYIKSLYQEMIATFPDLTGFYGPMAEAIPGRHSSWYAEAIVPGLKASGKNPRFIVHNWMVPLDQFIEDIVRPEVYRNTWVGIHAYNSEQITDAAPWPFVVDWAKQTKLPTVVMLYPANIANFPFNSPEFAYEIISEIKRIPYIKGFIYMEWSGSKISPLFRKALARYARTDEPYSDDPWLKILEEQFGNRDSARHWLNAYKISGRILPDKDALVYCPHDNLKRELSMPYEYFQFNASRPWDWQTSRVRGRALVPIWVYASLVAENPDAFENKDGTEESGWQYPTVRIDGGSSFDIIPPNHMAGIRTHGQQAFEEATLGRQTATRSQAEAQNMWMYMKGYKLLSQYFETKVKAATEAFIAKKNGSAARKTSARNYANQAYDEWVTFYQFCREESPKLNDLAQYYNNEDLHEVGMGIQTMPELLIEEGRNKDNLGTIFGW